MTTDIRKKSPEIIEDLYKQNYTILTSNENWTKNFLQTMIPYEIRPKVMTIEEYMKNSPFNIVFNTQIENFSAKLAFFMYQNPEFKGIQLKETFFSSTAGISIERNSFLYNAINDALQWLITGGIAQFIFNFYIEDYFPEKPKPPKEPKILAIDDLSYGFIIWLIASLITIFIFLVEIFVKYIWVKIIKWLKRGAGNLLGFFFIVNYVKNKILN